MLELLRNFKSASLLFLTSYSKRINLEVTLLNVKNDDDSSRKKMRVGDDNSLDRAVYLWFTQEGKNAACYYVP